jgi:hypothetical protein
MRKLILSTMFVTVLASGAMAQSTSGSKIQDRKENQQDRIANGVASGELTAGEAQKLENQESKINREIRRDRNANGGNLTNVEKQRLNRQQYALSKEIYNKKHNSATQHYGANEVDGRRKNQQNRIANGIKSGQLTAGEAARLEGQERKINQEVHGDRKANGGNLTIKEKAQVNRQLNRESARIYNQKHNAARGPH